MFLHEFTHVQTDQRVGCIKELFGQDLDQFSFTDAGWTNKNERSRTTFLADLYAGTFDCFGNQLHSLVLTDDAAFQCIFQTGYALQFAFADFAGRNTGPQLDHFCQIFLGHCHTQSLWLQLFQFGSQLHDLGFIFSQCFVVDILGFLFLFFHQQLAEFQIFTEFFVLVQLCIFQRRAGAGFVQQVDGFVRQEAVVDVALCQQDGFSRNRIADLHAMEVLVVFLDTKHNVDGVGDGRLIHSNRLEAAFQRSVFFNMLAVFVKSSCTDDLHLTAGQSRFQNISSVHAAFCVARTHQRVYFIDKENDIAAAFDVLQQTFHTALELSAELSACHQRSQIQQEQFFAQQHRRNFPCCQTQSDTFCNGGFTDARFTDEARVVFAAAVEDLHHALDLTFTADDIIDTTFSCFQAEIFAVCIQKFIFFLVFILGLFILISFFFAVVRRSFLFIINAVFCLRVHQILEEILQSRQFLRTAHFKIIAHFFKIGVHCFGEGHHLLIHAFQLIIADTQLIQHFAYLRDTQLFGALNAQAFVDNLAVFFVADKDHCHSLFTARTHHIWIHIALLIKKSIKIKIICKLMVSHIHEQAVKISPLFQKFKRIEFIYTAPDQSIHNKSFIEQCRRVAEEIQHKTQNQCDQVQVDTALYNTQ